MTRIAVSCAYYKCRPWIREAVQSVLAQTVEDIRIVVINDGDPDEPWDELADIGDRRLIRCTLKTNRGPYYAHEVVRRAFRDVPFFAIQDADDVSAPHRFERLLATINDKDAAASMLGGDYRGKTNDRRHREISADYRARYCHAGLHRMSALEEIGGYYGGSRYRVGWDSLIMNVHALRRGVAWVEEPLYLIRKRPDSLTHATQTAIRSPYRTELRAEYAAKYAQIYEAAPEDRTAIARRVMHNVDDDVDPADVDMVRAARRRSSRVVATMATLSSREALLEKAVASLLPQVDAMSVYLNGHEAVPSFLKHPKVAHAVLSREAGWRTGEAKLWFWDREEFKAPPFWCADDIALIVDDDIAYPPDYVEQVRSALERHPGAIVCVHGSILQRPFSRYVRDRWLTRAADALEADARVHVPGAGTMAFRAGDFRVSLREQVPWSHCMDVCVAVAARRQGVPVWAIARPAKWLDLMRTPAGGTSVFSMRSGARVDDKESEMIVAAGEWEQLEPSSDFTDRRLRYR